MTRFEWGKEVAPGITAVETAGHTPGHTSFVIAVGLEQAVLPGRRRQRAGPVPANPDWQVMFDSEPEKAVATRRRVYDMAAAEKMLVAGYHFPFPGHRLHREGRHRLSLRAGGMESSALRSINTRGDIMTELTRRGALAGAAAAALAPLAATTAAQAAAPMAGKQAPGFYRTKVGSYEITVLLDGVRPVKLENSPIRNASLDDVKAVLTATPPADRSARLLLPSDRGQHRRQARADRHRQRPRQPPDRHRLVPDQLTAAGIDPKTIDTVVISHFHGDHISGLRTADGALAYPNAEIMVPAKEWAFWSDEGAASRAPQGQQATFQNTKRIFGPIADKITKYEWGKEVAPGITALDTNGHTPGHTSFMIASGSGSLLYQADVTAGYALLQFHNPDWLVGGDMDGDAGGGDPPQALRSARHRQDAVVGLSHSVPVARLYREGRHRLSLRAGVLEPGALAKACFKRKGRPCWAAFALTEG